MSEELSNYLLDAEADQWETDAGLADEHLTAEALAAAPVSSGAVVAAAMGRHLPCAIRLDQQLRATVRGGAR